MVNGQNQLIKIKSKIVLEQEENTTPVTAVASTISDPIQQQLDQHALMKQISLLNKQLALLRANQTPQTIPLENVTNIFNAASSLLPQTSTTTSSNRANAPKAPTTTGAKRGPKPLPRDPVTGKIIRPRDSDGNVIEKPRTARKNKENVK